MMLYKIKPPAITAPAIKTCKTGLLRQHEASRSRLRRHRQRYFSRLQRSRGREVSSNCLRQSGLSTLQDKCVRCCTLTHFRVSSWFPFAIVKAGGDKGGCLRFSNKVCWVEVLFTGVFLPRALEPAGHLPVQSPRKLYCSLPGSRDSHLIGLCTSATSSSPCNGGLADVLSSCLS